jgi:hypothetical protein
MSVVGIDIGGIRTCTSGSPSVLPVPPGDTRTTTVPSASTAGLVPARAQPVLARGRLSGITGDSYMVDIRAVRAESEGDLGGDPGGHLPFPPGQQEADSYSESGWAGVDSNHRPQGYEPRALTG